MRSGAFRHPQTVKYDYLFNSALSKQKQLYLKRSIWSTVNVKGPLPKCLITYTALSVSLISTANVLQDLIRKRLILGDITWVFFLFSSLSMTEIVKVYMVLLIRIFCMGEATRYINMDQHSDILIGKIGCSLVNNSQFKFKSYTDYTCRCLGHGASR